MAPSTFASAAAGNSQSQMPTRDGGSEWSRRPNGNTQTFRRPSATSMQSSSQQQDPVAPSQPSARYVPPHRNGTLSDTRYSKDQLLDIFRAQQGSDGGLRDGLPNLYVGGWQPDAQNGLASASWARSEHSRDNQPGPDICWEKEGSIEPLGLLEMNDEERELFSTSVNTPLKPPTSNKDNQQSNGLGGRKVSISNPAGTPGGYGPLSPSATRGLGRRRDTSDSYPFPQNPLSSPSATFNPEDHRAASPPPSLQRRRTDVRDSNKAAEHNGDGDEKSVSTPFSSLKRNPTGPLSAGFAAPPSPWTNAPQSAGLSPMGSFGNFGLGQQSAQGDKRPALGSGRLESRFKNLLAKDNAEDSAPRFVERKTSMSSLSRVNEHESWRPQQSQDLGPIPSNEAEEDVPYGSAALTADADISPPHQRQAGPGNFGTPSRSESRDNYGFGTFGMTPDTAPGFGQGHLQQTPAQRQLGGNEPMSPTDTNPYKSPEQHGVDHLTEDFEGDGHDMQNAQLPGLGGFGGEQQQPFGGLGGLGALPSLGRVAGGPGPASDRSQTSSTGANRGFPSLGGFGPLGGVSGATAWAPSQGGLGTPSRQTAGLSNAFGGGIFGTSMGELQSPGLAGLGGSMMSPSAGLGSSRMASMFPSAMQDQMRHDEQDRDVGHERGGQQSFPGLGDPSFGLNELHSPYRELDQPSDQHTSQFGAPGQQSQPPIGQPSQQLGQLPSQSQGLPQQPPSSASNQPPPPQQRTMVMPDRMRWIYRDPQGQTQGPWSGLEMHDWYKAGFFSPELLVKKYEDPDYEPLAQLIRRIGNSREPFLVPQIGIPHGPASNNGPTAWAGAGATPTATVAASTAGGGGGNGASSASAGGAQPPFASSFPSFGTTLTADQQNALERRKQEEQYLMARQKEHLAQQQIAQRMSHQMQHNAPGQHGGLMPGQGQLHHHGSAQSLHSQPSFGSMTSPNAGAYQPSPSQVAQPGFFDNSFRTPGQGGGLGAVGAGVDNLGHIREEEIPGIMDRLEMGNRAAPGQFGAPGQPFPEQQQQQQHIEAPSAQGHHEQQVQQMLQDRARLQQEQVIHDAQQQGIDLEQPGVSERLQQFQQLQDQGALSGIDARFQPALAKQAVLNKGRSSAVQNSIGSPAAPQPLSTPPQELSLTEQVQKAASVQQSPAPTQSGFPRPFPPAPAPSQSPLPAPSAQRTGRQSVADQLQTEQRDLSQTPSVDTASAAVAPWASQPSEAAKGPSLKEIQEVEAKQAAEAEGMASAARRAAFQREMEAEAQAQASAAIAPPGLPASASWATTGGSPLTPTGSTASAWAKAAQKAAGPTSAKSMAQIQKEEEARKKKLVAVAAANVQATAMGGTAAPSGGKSYANLAGKISLPAVPSGPGGAWTTVGAGGKLKTPAAVPAAAAPRALSSGIVPSIQSPATTSKKPPTRSATMINPGMVNAHDEFRKWAVGELRPDLNKGIPAEEFTSNLIALPPDIDMLTEAVHGASSTIDSRHFAEEFIRRKKLADKGLVDTTAPLKTSSPHSAGVDRSGGWSEVAKKGPQKEVSKDETNGNGSFRVVPAKKKGGKR